MRAASLSMYIYIYSSTYAEPCAYPYMSYTYMIYLLLYSFPVGRAGSFQPLSSTLGLGLRAATKPRQSGDSIHPPTWTCLLNTYKTNIDIIDTQTARKANIVRPKSSRPLTWRKGAWNFSVERFLPHSRFAENQVKPRNRSTSNFQATPSPGGSPGSLLTKDMSFLDFP